jgi:WD40 repeat protein
MQDVTCLSPLADGIHVVSGSHDQTLRIWNMDTSRCAKVLEGHTDVSKDTQTKNVIV